MAKSHLKQIWDGLNFSSGIQYFKSIQVSNEILTMPKILSRLILYTLTCQSRAQISRVTEKSHRILRDHIPSSNDKSRLENLTST